MICSAFHSSCRKDKVAKSVMAVVARSILLSDDERLFGESLVFGMKNHECPVVFFADAVLEQAFVNFVDPVTVKTFAVSEIELSVQHIVDGVEGIHADVLDFFPKLQVFGLSRLKIHELFSWLYPTSFRPLLSMPFLCDKGFRARQWGRG